MPYNAAPCSTILRAAKKPFRERAHTRGYTPRSHRAKVDRGPQYQSRAGSEWRYFHLKCKCECECGCGCGCKDSISYAEVSCSDALALDAGGGVYSIPWNEGRHSPMSTLYLREGVDADHEEGRRSDSFPVSRSVTSFLSARLVPFETSQEPHPNQCRGVSKKTIILAYPVSNKYLR